MATREGNAQQNVQKKVVSTPNFLCRPELRDPMSIVMGFTPNPGKLRLCCRFTVECYAHGIYLEAMQPCPHMEEVLDATEAELEVAKPRAPTPDDTTGSTTTGRTPSPPPSLLRDLRMREQLLGSSATGCSSVFPILWTQVSKFVSTRPSAVATATTSLTSTTERLMTSKFTYHLFLARTARIPAAESSASTQQHDHQTQEVAKLVAHRLIFNTTNLHIRSVGSGVNALTIADLESVEHFRRNTISRLYSDGARGDNLTKVTIENLVSLKAIGESCFYRATTITHFTLKDCPVLQSIAEQFLNEATALVSVTYRNLPALQEVGDCWMARCESLKEVEISSLPNLAWVNRGFLGSCGSLEVATFSNLPKLSTVGAGFLAEC